MRAKVGTCNLQKYIKKAQRETEWKERGRKGVHDKKKWEVKGKDKEENIGGGEGGGGGNARMGRVRRKKKE